MGREVTSKSIDGITDLVVVAPIKPGMIEAFENITYETRLKLVAEALHKIRVNAREHELISPYADTVERILTLFNFRIGVLDRGMHELAENADQGTVRLAPRRYMFLVATFDGPFEPYMRLIWKPLGPFLDLLLCNCEGYKLATQTGFPEYIDWVRRHQVEPSIFYSTSGQTLRDQFYLDQLEKLTRESEASGDQPPLDQLLAELTLMEPQVKADKVWADPENIGNALRLSFEAINVLYRLADFFPPDRQDSAAEGMILLQAARELLPRLPERIGRILAAPSSPPTDALKKVLAMLGVTGLPNTPYRDQWKWFAKPLIAAPVPEPTAPSPREVQKGLMTGYDGGGLATAHSMVLLFAITDPVNAAQTIQTLLQPTWEADPGDLGLDIAPGFTVHRNIAFTAAGLRAMGISGAQYDSFPKEFRDGLFERAPSLGDVRQNHPRRWRLPYRFDVRTIQNDKERPAVHSEEIDLIVQWRLAAPFDAADTLPQFKDFEAAAFELETTLKSRGLFQTFQQRLGQILVMSPTAMAADNAGASAEQIERLHVVLGQTEPFAIQALAFEQAAEFIGLSLLAVESSFRPLATDASDPAGYQNRDHFGFADGLSQPVPDLTAVRRKPGEPFSDKVEFGELFVGHRNCRGDTPEQQNWDGQHGLQVNGSFMVLRKIAQFPDRFDALDRGENLPVGTIKQAIVGRKPDGTPLLGPGDNSFTYEADPKQLACPFSAHIRLANPRDNFQERPAPRILRRGMSYGPRYDSSDPDSKKQPRGIMFIAYMASLAEQYEVIQRWLNGANPTGVASAANDPLTGVSQEPGGRTFRFRSPAGGVAHVRIAEAEPLTQLQWGLYAFLPSRTALAAICSAPVTTLSAPAATVGQQAIDQIARLDPADQRREWKRLLEDFSVKDTADQNLMPEVWRTIRQHHNGALRLAHGVAFEGTYDASGGLTKEDTPVVLVGSWDKIEQVLSNPADFSVSQQEWRTKDSFGGIYVSMDPKPGETEDDPQSDYARESIATNRIVYRFSEENQEEVFGKAYALASERLALAKKFNAAIGITNFFKVELRRDFLSPVLGGLCQWLFDIPDAEIAKPDEGYIDKGPWGWDPVDQAGGTSAAAGKRKPRCPADFMAPSRFSFYPRPSGRIQDYGREHGHGLRKASFNLVSAKRQSFSGQLSKPMAEAIANDDLLARNIIGNMEGMLPPTDGIMRGIFYDWIDRDEIWRNQSRFLELRPKSEFPPTLSRTQIALEQAVTAAMCKRPAPDLLYRTATRATRIGDVEVAKGDTVILGLVSPMLSSLETPDAFGTITPDIEPVFGGYRKAAWQPEGTPTHACPAYKMVMAMVYGMIAALFDAGRIVVQPASLILQISDWPGAPPLSVEDTEAIRTQGFSPFA